MSTGKQEKSLSVDLRVVVVANAVPNAGGFVGWTGTIVSQDARQWWRVKLDRDPSEWPPVAFRSDELAPA